MKQLIKRLAYRIAPSLTARVDESIWCRREWRGLEKYREGNSIEACVDFVLENRTFFANQKRTEIIGLLRLVQELQPKRVLEIGTALGGTFFLFCRVADKQAQMLTLDLNQVRSRKKIYEKFGGHQQSVQSWQGDTHNASTLERVHKWLLGEPLDFLFIDGDHSFEGVAQDFEMYSPFVRPGGLIAFHDIHPDFGMQFGKPTGNDVGGVPNFWATLKDRFKNTYEFIDQQGQDGYGIGVIRVPVSA